MKRYVTGFMFSANMLEVLLILKRKPFWQKDKFNGLGGKVEQNETNQRAMVREFWEECGIQTQKEDWHSLLSIICPKRNHVEFFYTCSDNIYSAKSIEEETVKIFAADNLPRNIIPNLNWIIPLCQDEGYSSTRSDFLAE